ncbi:peptide deformylase [Clostridium algidicarnis]|uniref:peptide deformylase n=1 Tax=Clostridium algidicarnis TaxID=37659 RepID=UPI0004964145|nr:peptide deformylase [Clostridium algidicarnis]
MIKPIVKDILFLGQKSEDATKNDIIVIDDLIDTLKANLEHCVGLAGNMIGVKKHILVFTGFTAQIIQHEMDHFEGIII